MTVSQSDWPEVPGHIDPDSNERRFFNPHQWETVEAITARIMPTDHDPGAREARVVVFIDRYLSGTGHIFATGDGEGFLQLQGKRAQAWRARIATMQEVYKAGIADVDRLANETFGADFKHLNDDQQDEVFAKYSGQPKPPPIDLGRSEAVNSFLQGVADDGMGFFDAICLHTRQGFYSDPVYGGNKDRVGWDVIGFPGPKSLRDTQTCEYSLEAYFVQDYAWEELVPQYGESQGT